VELVLKLAFINFFSIIATSFLYQIVILNNFSHYGNAIQNQGMTTNILKGFG